MQNVHDLLTTGGSAYEGILQRAGSRGGVVCSGGGTLGSVRSDSRDPLRIFGAGRLVSRRGRVKQLESLHADSWARRCRPAFDRPDDVGQGLHAHSAGKRPVGDRGIGRRLDRQGLGAGRPARR